LKKGDGHREACLRCDSAKDVRRAKEQEQRGFKPAALRDSHYFTLASLDDDQRKIKETATLSIDQSAKCGLDLFFHRGGGF